MLKLVAAMSCSVLLLAGCGSDSSSGGSDSTTPATATTSTAAPAPTSSPATSSTTSGTTTTADARDAPTTAAPTPPTQSTTVPTVDTTDSTDTDSTDTDSTGAAGSGGEYAPVASPVVPGSTEPVSAGNRHPDGVYYASVSEGSDPVPPAGSVVFEVVQLFTGPDCMAHFGDEDEDACVNDYGVEIDPTAHVEVSLDHQFISVVDAATQQSYQISGAELYALLLGDVPSAGAPADYLYSGFGFLVTYEGGEITRLEQWWTP